jgi:hypothetical protein
MATRRWSLTGLNCAELRDVAQFLQTEGLSLVQLEFALDAPQYDLKIESVHRRIVSQTQGLGRDAGVVKRMTSIRDAAIAGRCEAR